MITYVLNITWYGVGFVQVMCWLSDMFGCFKCMYKQDSCDVISHIRLITVNAELLFVEPLIFKYLILSIKIFPYSVEDIVGLCVKCALR